MSNFELIDDYLSNRLNEQDRTAFEHQLQGDPALKEDVEFQRQVVQGVRQARAIELKNILNNVPVSGSSWSGGKAAAAVMTAGLVAVSLYIYFKEDIQPVTPTEAIQQEITTPPADHVVEPSVTPIPAPNSNESTSATTEQLKEKPKVLKENKPSSPVRKPDIQVVDPSSELTESKPEAAAHVSPGRSEISASKMEVMTGLSDKKHNFHYQFMQGKLLLYGPFDKSLYEILEIHGEGHAVFLFYKENYYLLDERQEEITELKYIQDTELLKKLKEYRGR